MFAHRNEGVEDEYYSSPSTLDQTCIYSDLPRSVRVSDFKSQGSHYLLQGCCCDMTGQEEVPGGSGVGLGRHRNCCRCGLWPCLTPHRPPHYWRPNKAFNTTNSVVHQLWCWHAARFQSKHWLEYGLCIITVWDIKQNNTPWTKLQDTKADLFLFLRVSQFAESLWGADILFKNEFTLVKDKYHSKTECNRNATAIISRTTR